MRKIIFTLNIDNYSPEITAYTYPAIQKWAEKIGAEVIEITERKFPDMPVVYEKFQVYELAKANPADWYIYIDSDALISVETPDITELLDKKTVFQVNSDPAHIRFSFTNTDSRDIGTCNWFTIFSDECIELFNPEIGMTPDEIFSRCTPTEKEALFFGKEHLIDDFILSSNLARHGFSYKNAKDIFELSTFNFFHHEYLSSTEDKLTAIKTVSENWGKVEEEKEAMLKDFHPDASSTLIDN